VRKALILLGILDDSDVEWMIRVANKRQVATGGQLIRERMPIDSFFIVLDGAFAITAKATGDKRIATLFPGEILGEMSFVDSRPPSATVTAVRDSLVLDIPRTELSQRLVENIGFNARLYRSLAIFLAHRLRDTVTTLGYGKVLQLDESAEDEGEIPLDLLDSLSLAGLRFGILQERTRTTGSLST
jgi:CRP/FNR family cyclic AMP-dependent transcriptional regulator